MEKIRKNRKPVSLKIRLLLLLVPLILCYTMALTAVNSSYILRSTGRSLEETLSQTVRITSAHIAQNIANSKELTTLLANQIATTYETELLTPFEQLDAARFADEIAQIGVDYGFLHMMVADTDGYTRTALHTDLRAVSAPYFTAIIDDAQTCYVSDVTLDQGSFNGKYVLNFSAPIKSASGKILGVLVCKADAAELSTLVGGICVGENGSTFVMDSRGQCIAHKDAGMLFSGEAYLKYRDNAAYPTLNALWDAMVRQDAGYMDYDLEGGRIAAFSRIDGTNNWSIAVTVSEDEFMRDANEARYATLWISLAMIVVIAILMSLAFRITTRGIRRITHRLETLSEGDLHADVRIDRSSDETYRLSLSAAKLTRVIQGMISETEHTLGEIARGNLTVTPSVDYPGDFAEIKGAIQNNLNKLNELIQRISRTSEEVARGSAQMASGASGLAQGASEQASSLEELFETVTTLAQRTYEIGGMDRRKLTDADDDDTGEASADEIARRKIEAADTLAEKLTIAIARIAEASGSIRRIASSIESISSETGMLALNASVEATHAGDAGRGFSVIASEIRSLSDKSREAAKDADNKIDSIARAVDRGTQLVDITVTTIGDMTLAMDQVKSALEQISNIVENIAATAEETAAGSEELSAQAELLKRLVAEFKYHSDEADGGSPARPDADR